MKRGLFGVSVFLFLPETVLQRSHLMPILEKTAERAHIGDSAAPGDLIHRQIGAG